MQQVIDVWGTITGTKGLPVANLFLRGRSLVWRQQIGGKRVARSVAVRRLREGEVLGRDLVKQAVEWMKRAEAVAVDEARGWDALEGAKVRKDDATFGEVFEVFQAAAKRRGEPSDKAVYGYQWALRKVVQVAEGLVSPDAVDGKRVSLLAGQAGGELVTRYVEKVLAERGNGASTLRSIKSTVNQARQVFQAGFLEEYEALKLPDLSRFMQRFTVRANPVGRQAFSAEQAAVLARGREFRESRPDLYAFWFLGYYCALRSAEIVQARRRWVREYQVTAADRAAWMGERATVWVLDCGLDSDTRLKNAQSAGVVPLADDVAGELLRLSEGREFIVPGETLTDREAVHDAFNAWLVEQGWAKGKGQKKAHDLRALRMQRWAGAYGEATAKIWMRHEVKGVSANYLGRVSMALVLGERPLGLAE